MAGGRFFQNSPDFALQTSAGIDSEPLGGKALSTVLQELAALVAAYPHYARLVRPNDIDDIALQYLTAAQLI